MPNTAKLERPKGWSNRDVLCGVLAAAASQLKIPCALDVAAKACEPLWQGRRIDSDWYPVISPAHARTAVCCARAALNAGGISKSEYDFVCSKVRRVLVRAQPLESPDAHENQSAT